MLRANQIVPSRSRWIGSSCLSGCVGGAILAAAVANAAQAGPSLPQGGSVASGVAVISSSPNAINIGQTTSKAVINWSSFNVGAANKVVFSQPDAQSATLNRVTGSTNSTIAGEISANGTVYLVNPNGIAITPQGSIQTGGGFVASTLDITDADFLAGKIAFTGDGASAGISNAGHILAGQGSYVALLGGQVANSGSISVPYGKIGLGSGEQITLDLNGDGFMQVAVPTSSPQTAGALIDVSGSITAPGGRIVLSASSLANAVRNIINVPGTLNADSATGDGGSIQLLGGEGGTVIANGVLTARATGPTGDGGSVETSGASVNFTGLTVDTSSAHGLTGTWVVDPTNLTIDQTAANAINSNMATNNILLATYSADPPSGPGVSSPGSGDIDVNAPLAWSSTHTLTINAFNNLALNSTITAPNGGLTLSAYNTQTSTQGTVLAAGAISLGAFTLTHGAWSQVGSLPAFSATSFDLGTGATFLRAAAGAGTSASPYQITDVYGLQGVTGAGYYVLINNINASGTAAWNAGAGFVPQTFSGNLNGQGWAISNITINEPSQNNVGLFGTNSGSISNLGLVGGSISGGNNVGALVGDMLAGSISSSYSTSAVNVSGLYGGGLIGAIELNRTAPVTVTGSYATGTVTGAAAPYVGGLVGSNTGGSISQSYATGSVTGFEYVGGLVGENLGGTITQSYATGAVSGGGYVGGLAGASLNYTLSNPAGTAMATISNSYATGAITEGGYSGGLVGALSGSVTQSYATGNVTDPSGQGYAAGGLVGWNEGGTITQTYASGNVTGSNLAGGLVGLEGTGSSQSKISLSYSTGAVNAPRCCAAGGLIGFMTDGTVDQSYSTGAVTNGNGFVAQLNGGTITNSYWDSYSSGSASSGASSGVSAVTSNPSQSGAANYAYKTSAYGAFTAASWAFLNGQTRPFGAWEVPVVAGGQATINNGHQLQLIDLSSLTATYTLGGNICHGLRAYRHGRGGRRAQQRQRVHGSLQRARLCNNGSVDQSAERIRCGAVRRRRRRHLERRPHQWQRQRAVERRRSCRLEFRHDQPGIGGRRGDRQRSRWRRLGRATDEREHQPVLRHRGGDRRFATRWIGGRRLGRNDQSGLRHWAGQRHGRRRRRADRSGFQHPDQPGLCARRREREPGRRRSGRLPRRFEHGVQRLCDRRGDWNRLQSALHRRPAWRGRKRHYRERILLGQLFNGAVRGLRRLHRRDLFGHGGHQLPRAIGRGELRLYNGGLQRLHAERLGVPVGPEAFRGLGRAHNDQCRGAGDRLQRPSAATDRRHGIDPCRQLRAQQQHRSVADGRSTKRKSRDLRRHLGAGRFRRPWHRRGRQCLERQRVRVQWSSGILRQPERARKRDPGAQ
jgi:filamentous hemagglutinin family protein